MILKDRYGMKYTVHFYHWSQHDQPSDDTRFNRTTCTLHVGDCIEVRPCHPRGGYVEATAKCNLDLDDFTRSEGRRIALTKVMDKANLSRSTRTDLWLGYFAKTQFKPFNAFNREKREEK